MIKNIGKNTSKSLCGNYSQTLLGHSKQSQTNAPKTTSKRLIKKTEEATGDLISNEVAHKVIKFSRGSPQNSSKTVESKTQNIGFDREIPKRKNIYLHRQDSELLIS